MDRQNTNQTLGSTTTISEHPGPVDAAHAADEADEGGERAARHEGDVETGRTATRGAPTARAAPTAAGDDETSSDDAVPGGAWRGQEVAHEPAHQASRDAARAANFLPKRRGDEEPESYDHPKRADMSPEEVEATQELKRQAAAEDHEAARAEGRKTSPKSL